MLRGLLIFTLALVMSVAGAVIIFNSGVFHNRIERLAAESLGAPLNLGRIKMAYRWPLTLVVGKTRLDHPMAEVSWETLQVQLKSFRAPYHVSLLIRAPNIHVKTAPAPSQPTEPSTPQTAEGGSALPPLPIHLEVQLVDAAATAPGVKVERSYLEFEQRPLLVGSARVELKAYVRSSLLPVPIPVQLSSKSLTLRLDTVKADGVTARIAGLQAVVKGASLLKDDRHRWLLDLQAPDLAAMPTPTEAEVFADQWRGSVDLKAEVLKDGPNQPWRTEGHINAKNIFARLKWRQDNMELTGPMTLQMESQFATSGTRYQIPKLAAHFDLSNAQLVIQDLVRKPPRVPLKARIQALGDQKSLQVQAIDLEFWRLAAKASGRVELNEPYNSQWNLLLQKSPLKGLEELVLPLKSSPVSGEVEAQVQWAGSPLKPMEGRLILQSLKLHQLAGRLNYQAENIKIDGPFQVNLSAQGEWAKGVVKGGRVSLQSRFPEIKDLLPSGQLSANVQLEGAPKTELPWPQWPLRMSGQTSVHLAHYALATPKEQAPPGAPPAPTPTTTPQGFLPSGPFTENLDLGVGVQIDQIKKEKWTFRNLTVQGRMRKGVFTGQVQLGEIFGGLVKASQLNVPLLTPRPTLQGQVEWSALSIEQALDFMKPEFKTFANGRARGRAQWRTLLPTEADFMKALKVDGEATFQPVTLNTVKLGDLINEMIRKVPVLKLSPAKVEPLKGTVEGKFQLSDQVVRLSQVRAIDQANSELKLDGTVALASMTGDLKGQFHWSQPTVKGCIYEGNADPQGRMVIPLSVKGSLLEPQFSLLEDIARKLAGKALECEKKRAIEKLKKEGEKELKKHLNKALDDLFGR